MPRAARLIVPGEPHHVIQRGHNRAQTFFSAKDYQLYLGLLEQFAAARECAIHAFALMPNHLHLLLTPYSKDAISCLMATVNQRFVQSVNRRLLRCGSLWQGRFKTSLVDTRSYFLTCQRYFELNPVRARLVGRADEYPWTSFRSHATEESLSFLTPHDVYLRLGANGFDRRQVYRFLFEQPLTQEELDRIRVAAAGNRPLGDEEFLERLRASFGIRVKRARPGPPRADRREPRDALIL